ncbi:MAG: patatin-like phospholipase family protein, partial [Mycobacterium sp.]
MLEAGNPVRRALVLSGGGSKGQYHVGALRHMLGDLKREYHIVTGVSVGALIGGFIAMYRIGNEVKCAAELEALFAEVENKHIWKHWFLFRRFAGLWKSSFLNSAPLQQLVAEKLDTKAIRASGCELRVGAVNLATGQYRVFDQTHIPLDKAILASASFPTMFNPVQMNGALWTDGGVRTVTPLGAAIKAGATEIDVLLCAPQDPLVNLRAAPNALDMALRALQLLLDEVMDEDLKICQLYNQLAAAGVSNKAHIPVRVIRPKAPVNEDSLHFDRKEAKRIREVGYR